MGAWRDELVAKTARVDGGEVSAASLLVASEKALVADVAAACAQLPQIEGLTYQEVAPGVIRAVAAPGGASTEQVAAGAFALDDLRRRLDAKSIASAVEWTAPNEAAVGGGRVSSSGIIRPAQVHTHPPFPLRGSSESIACGHRVFRLSSAGQGGAGRASSLPAEFLAEVSDEDLAREMLRRATSRCPPIGVLGRAEGGGTI